MGPDEPLATTGNTAGLPDVSAPDGDVVMTDDINSAHRGNKVPQVTTNLSFLSPDDSSHLSLTEASLVEKSAPNTSPDDASTTSPNSSALAASPTADCLPIPGFCTSFPPHLGLFAFAIKQQCTCFSDSSNPFPSSCRLTCYRVAGSCNCLFAVRARESTYWGEF